MILTCPACGTQYAVKDGAIPEGGRQVRCASCKHSWHQDPEPAPGAAEDDRPSEDDESLAAAALIEPRTGPEAEERAYVAAMAPEPSVPPEPEFRQEPAPEPEPADYDYEAPPVENDRGGRRPALAVPVPEPEPEPEPQADEVTDAWRPTRVRDDAEFSPFAEEEPARGGRRLLPLLLGLLLIAALAAAFWFLAPPAWKQRLGIAGAGDTPLQLMMTHSDRQTLASGNELLAVSGRVINPTEESQTVPPIQAQLRSSSGRLVYSWTIAPPARVLAPRASATFNSAEMNVPAGGDELTITLGSPKA